MPTTLLLFDFHDVEDLNSNFLIIISNPIQLTYANGIMSFIASRHIIALIGYKLYYDYVSLRDYF